MGLDSPTSSRRAKGVMTGWRR